MKYRYHLLRSFVNLGIVFTIFAINTGAIGAAGSLSFLSTIPAARPASMGSAFAAVSDDINAIFVNPAGLGTVAKIELSGTYNNWFEGITYMCIAGCYSIKNIATVGVSGIVLNYGDLIQTEEVSGNIKDTGKKFQPQDLVVSAGAAREIIPTKLYIGAVGKVVSESIGPSASSGFGLDAGVLFKILDNVNIGAAVQNLGISSKFENKTFSAPLNLRAGGMYNLKFVGKGGGLALAGDLALCDKDMVICLGSELSYPLGEEFILRIRGGYQVGKILGGFSIGGGIIYKTDSTDIIIDVGYVPVKDLGDTLRIGVGVRM
jgi:hypothetical protein